MSYEETPNGLELSCPAEAGRITWIVRQAGRPSKLQSMPRPPGQLQRVVRQQRVQSGLIGNSLVQVDG